MQKNLIENDNISPIIQPLDVMARKSIRNRSTSQEQKLSKTPNLEKTSMLSKVAYFEKLPAQKAFPQRRNYKLKNTISENREYNDDNHLSSRQYSDYQRKNKDNRIQSSKSTKVNLKQNPSVIRKSRRPHKLIQKTSDRLRAPTTDHQSIHHYRTVYNKPPLSNSYVKYQPQSWVSPRTRILYENENIVPSSQSQKQPAKASNIRPGQNLRVKAFVKSSPTSIESDLLETPVHVQSQKKYLSEWDKQNKLHKKRPSQQYRNSNSVKDLTQQKNLENLSIYNTEKQTTHNHVPSTHHYDYPKQQFSTLQKIQTTGQPDNSREDHTLPVVRRKYHTTHWSKSARSHHD
ncbi:uncharacterized protein LOC111083225 [Limulus polyphemus]|uniref:Uncharacterized protein LOC111083225 n=1 Tax=Limulus polyphemus TaxID=6850 RepID=A0ABM1RV83_LIMPO|nr:uncharacterized protein LOC111083225 [Limulus polyphemus]